MRGAILYCADLRFAELISVNLAESNLTKANFTGANLTGARLDKSILQNAVLECDAIGTVFDSADLRGVQMYRCRLRGARFENASLQNSILGCTDLLGTSFRGADLQNSDLEEAVGIADFSDANLLGCTTYDFDFRLGRSIFCRTIMQDGSIRNDGCLDISENRQYSS